MLLIFFHKTKTHAKIFVFHSLSEKTEYKERIEEFLKKYDFMDRLHGLEIRSISSKSAIASELLKNVLDGKYQNGISFEFREGDPFFENVASAAQFATEFHGLKR